MALCACFRTSSSTSTRRSASSAASPDHLDVELLKHLCNLLEAIDQLRTEALLAFFLANLCADDLDVATEALLLLPEELFADAVLVVQLQKLPPPLAERFERSGRSPPQPAGSRLREVARLAVASCRRMASRSRSSWPMSTIPRASSSKV